MNFQDCILWVGRIDREGYGRFGKRLAHRIAYEANVGQIPEGRDVHHVCENKACVNPDHLVAIAMVVHRRIQPSAHKTTCAHGHPFDSANTYLRPDGSRDCRKCSAARQRAYKIRKRAAA